MKSIKTPHAIVHFSESGITELNGHLKASDYSSIFIIVDENTHEHCLPVFLPLIETHLSIEIIELVSGEENKNIETCTQVWSVLSELGADRKTLIVNLGGGVLTDMGGFIAATFKRGVHFINIPTTLLSMVDASVGGKTGVDLGSLKNQIGVITEPIMVVVLPVFLNSLEKRQLRSGYAEMLKHGLIQSEAYWKSLSNTTNYQALTTDIHRSVQIKAEVVTQDPTEQNIRKILNFGHTLGHAIESYFLENDKKETLLHGEAIAIGMVLEAFLSCELVHLSKKELIEIKGVFQKHFDKIIFSNDDIEKCISYLKFDKKNTHGAVKFALISKIGKPVIDVLVPESSIREAFEYYMNA